MSIFNWLHISDFHFGKDDYEEPALCSKIIELIHDLYKKESIVFNAIFITGDIGFSGRANQYGEFKKFLEQLDNPYNNIGNKPRIYIVPGNHDANRENDRLYRNLYDFDTDSTLSLSPTEAGFKQRQFVIQRFKEFNSAIGNSPFCFPMTEMFSERGFFLDSYCISEKNIGIAGINTAWLAHGAEDEGNITPGYRIVEAAVNELKQEKYNYKILLGHHPLTFFRQVDSTAIPALLAKHNIIYLCGHLHKNKAGYQIAASGKPFLSFSTGASFLPKEADKSRHSVQFGVLDEDGITIRIRRWMKPQAGWGPDDSDYLPLANYVGSTGSWRFDFLQTQGAKGPISEPVPKSEYNIGCPMGWKVIDKKFIDGHKHKEPNPKEMLMYFDGLPPAYSFVFSLPIRSKVDDCVQEFVMANVNGVSKSMLLCGAGSEGKSTMSLQIIDKLVSEHGWVALHCFEPSKNVKLEFSGLETINKPIIMVADNASLISEALYNFREETNIQVHLLLVSVLSDWQKSKASNSKWKNIPRRIICGIDKEEARCIVETWSRYPKGLGKLSEHDLDTAAAKLLEESECLLDEDEPGADGALFGAIMNTRNNEEYHIERVKAIMERLDDEQFDMFMKIAAMHEEKAYILTDEVLAGFYRRKAHEIRKIFLSLGKEAVRKSGDVMYMRHSALAKYAIKIAEEDYDFNKSDIFPELAQAAVIAGSRIETELLSKWKYLANHFVKYGRKHEALRIAEAVYNVEPYTHLLGHFLQIHLAQTMPDYDFVYNTLSNEVKEIYSQKLLPPFSVVAKKKGDIELSVYLSMVCISDYATDTDGETPGVYIIRRVREAAKDMLRLSELNGDDSDLKNAGFALAKIWRKNERRPSEIFNINNSEHLKELKKYDADKNTIRQHLELGMKALLKIVPFDRVPQSVPRLGKITFDKWIARGI